MKTNKENPPQYEWGPFPFGDGARILDIRYDPVFKAVFTRETAESRAALSDLISALIGRTVTVETIIANEPPVDDLRQRYLRFDVACKTGKGEQINVEMSFNPEASEPVRLEYHAARLYLRQNIHGKNKIYDDLKETYQITIQLAKSRQRKYASLADWGQCIKPAANKPFRGLDGRVTSFGRSMAVSTFIRACRLFSVTPYVPGKSFCGRPYNVL